MSEALVPRVLVLVCDSWGVGDAPDAAAYGDEGSDTIANTARAVGGITAPNLEAHGPRDCSPTSMGWPAAAAAGTAHGRATERSAGKDTTTGHWEMMGIQLDEPFPRVPGRVPAGDHRAVPRRRSGTACSATCRHPGRRSSRSWARSICAPVDPIVYTSGDSVFQIATHVVDRAARAALRVVPDRSGPAGRARIAWDGSSPARSRESRARSCAARNDVTSPCPPPGPTVLDAVRRPASPCCGVGKIDDIFSGQGITEARYSDSNDDGVDITLEYLRRPGTVAGLHEPGRLRFEVRAPQRPSRLREMRSRRSTAGSPSSSKRWTAGSCSSRATTVATRRPSPPTIPGNGRHCSPPA